MGTNLGDECGPLLLVGAFLEEDFRGLSYDDIYQEPHYVSAQICGRSMQEVLVDIREHSGTGPEVVEGTLQALRVRSVL